MTNSSIYEAPTRRGYITGGGGVVVGEWPESDGEAYPDVPGDERLFDRERLAEVITGEN